MASISLLFIIAGIESKVMKYETKQENVTHNQERKLSIEPNPEMVQVFQLSDGYFIIAIINT